MAVTRARSKVASAPSGTLASASTRPALPHRPAHRRMVARIILTPIGADTSDLPPASRAQGAGLEDFAQSRNPPSKEIPGIKRR